MKSFYEFDRYVTNKRFGAFLEAAFQGFDRLLNEIQTGSLDDLGQDVGRLSVVDTPYNKTHTRKKKRKSKDINDRYAGTTGRGTLAVSRKMSPVATSDAEGRQAAKLADDLTHLNSRVGNDYLAKTILNKILRNPYSAYRNDRFIDRKTYEYLKNIGDKLPQEDITLRLSNQETDQPGFVTISDPNVLRNIIDGVLRRSHGSDIKGRCPDCKNDAEAKENCKRCGGSGQVRACACNQNGRGKGEPGCPDCGGFGWVGVPKETSQQERRGNKGYGRAPIDKNVGLDPSYLSRLDKLGIIDMPQPSGEEGDLDLGPKLRPLAPKDEASVMAREVFQFLRANLSKPRFVKLKDMPLSLDQIVNELLPWWNVYKHGVKSVVPAATIRNSRPEVAEELLSGLETLADYEILAEDPQKEGSYLLKSLAFPEPDYEDEAASGMRGVQSVEKRGGEAYNKLMPKVHDIVSRLKDVWGTDTDLEIARRDPEIYKLAQELWAATEPLVRGYGNPYGVQSGHIDPKNQSDPRVWHIVAAQILERDPMLADKDMPASMDLPGYKPHGSADVNKTPEFVPTKLPSQKDVDKAGTGKITAGSTFADPLKPDPRKHAAANAEINARMQQQKNMRLDRNVGDDPTGTDKEKKKPKTADDFGWNDFMDKNWTDHKSKETWVEHMMQKYNPFKKQ